MFHRYKLINCSKRGQEEYKIWDQLLKQYLPIEQILSKSDGKKLVKLKNTEEDHYIRRGTIFKIRE